MTLLARLRAERDRLNAVPVLERGFDWHMNARNVALLIRFEEAKAPAVTLDRRFLRVPPARNTERC